MSRPRPPQAVKLFMSHIYADGHLLKDVLQTLSSDYGGVDFVSRQMTFHYTDYYREEMGPSLERRFVFFSKLISPESLPDVKLCANAIEERTSTLGNRRINIDPGYISQAHLILATGKGYTHRPYLREGIYADLTLVYKGKSFETLPWTYPDYGEKETIKIFNKVRTRYLMQLKGE